ncbi:hypothetical protein P7C73_g1846, partial [Tremellales sp. Uapishka_1]
MLRPRNLNGPSQATSQPEPDTPLSHYPSRIPSMSNSTDLNASERGSMSNDDTSVESSSEKDILASAGLAGRRGSGPMSLGLGNLAGGGKRKSKGGYKLGLSQRAWVILTVVIGFILLSKLLVPSSDTNGHVHHSDAHLLVPRDYLNSSAADPAPFDFCPVFGPGDAIAARRGQFELLKSRLHLGSGARIQRVLQKAMSGAPITMSVLGGSVSACMGAGDDPVGTTCYPSKFFNWWNSVFPHPANELTNGATKRTDSAYYAYCAAHHLPDKTDLVILEFDAADPNDPEWLQHFELLVRSVLVRPEMPAVIILGHFSPQIQAQNGFAGPELLHNAVAQFYDVPHISSKGVLYDQYLQTPDLARQAFYHDPNLANSNGHDLIADVLISYLMSQICSGWSTLQGNSFDVPAFGVDTDPSSSGPSLLGGVGLRKGMMADPGDGESSEDSALTNKFQALRVPQARLADRPADVHQFREIEPFCVAASDLISPLPPSLFYGSGWHTYHPPKSAIVEDRHYWYAEQPTSRLRIPLRLGAGDVGVYFLQSPVEKPLGVVRCWVDDNSAGGVDLHGTAEIEEVMATLVMIDRGVSKGSHFVECQLQGEAGGSSPPFKILGM